MNTAILMRPSKSMDLYRFNPVKDYTCPVHVQHSKAVGKQARNLKTGGGKNYATGKHICKDNFGDLCVPFPVSDKGGGGRGKTLKAVGGAEVTRRRSYPPPRDVNDLDWARKVAVLHCPGDCGWVFADVNSKGGEDRERERETPI